MARLRRKMAGPGRGSRDQTLADYLPTWTPLLVFGGTVLLLLYAYSLVISVSWFDGFLTMHAVVTGQMLRMFGVNVDTTGTILANDRVAFTIISECTAVAPIIIYGAGVLAFPAGWRAKAVGLSAGAAALVIVNFVRITSLFFIGMYYPSALDVFHLIVWQSVMIILAVGVLFVWTARVSDRVVGQPAS
ncbi:MAG: archaeosortase/exosortase family protein [Chloroflexi bacterium]|nr:archaeosortase/exosortase family protein [Chloroflexota bacterium]